MNTQDAYDALCRPQDEEALVRSVMDGLQQGRSEAHTALLAVPPEAFTAFHARDVWEAIRSLYQAGALPDLPAIERELSRRRAVLDRDGWLKIRSWLVGEAWGDEGSLAQSVLALHQRRSLFGLYRCQAEHVLNPLEDHLEIAQSTAAESLRICAGGADEPEKSGDAIMRLVDSHLKFREDQEGGGKLAWFGLETLDGDPKDGGVIAAAGHVVIIAARPGIGKTALAVQIAGETLNHGEEVFVASLELSRYEFWSRLAGWVTDTRRGLYWAGTYAEYHVSRLKAKVPALNRVRVWDPSRPPWSRIEAKIRGAAMKGIRVVILDHFSEINFSGLAKGASKKYEAASECGQRIKALAKELGICLVLLAQLNREIPPGEIPGPEHLRETGELEQIAYSIILLYRDAPTRMSPSVRRGPQGPDAPQEPPTPGLNYSLGKNRDGKANFHKALRFDGATCRLAEEG